MGPSADALATARWADPEFVAGRYEFKPGAFWLGRHPHLSEIPLGYLDDRHVLVCAGTRSGKGRSLIINNMAVWPGSLVSYDPKGDLATILASRRGAGNKYCEGMGQKVFVLDPKRVAEVDETYRAYFNPLDVLDPNDEDFLIWCDRIANVIVKKTEGTDAATWVDKAKVFISMLIAHVASSKHYQGPDRSLLTVYRLCQEGLHELAEKLRKQSGKAQDPFYMLLLEVEASEAGNGELSTLARSFLIDKASQPKLFNSVRNEAAMQLAFLKSQAIQRVLAPSGEEGARPLDMNLVKRDPNGVSVFVVLPTEDSDEFSRWANTVFLCLFAAARHERGKPASGHQTLCVLDEFLDLGRNEYIASALRNIAGAGVKLVIVVQGLGELNGLYKEGADAFFTNSGLKLFFGDTGRDGPAFIEKQLGETQIVLTVRNSNQSYSEQESISEAESRGESSSTSHAKTQGTNFQNSRTSSRGSSWSSADGWSDSINWGNSSNWGKSEGQNAGRNYGPHIFFQPWTRSTNYGTSTNHSRGGASSRGNQRGRNGSQTRGGQASKSQTRSTGGQTSETHTQQSGESRQWTRTQGSTKGYSISGGVAEQIFKKPLLAAHEVQLYLRAFTDDDIDQAAYPGMMLVLISGELPFFVRRTNYDQDPYFERCFSPDPAFGFIPIEDQPMLGYEYTAENIFTFRVPPEIRREDYEIIALVKKHQKITEPTLIYRYAPLNPDSGSNEPEGYFGTQYDARSTVVDVHVTEGFADQEGRIVTLRTSIPVEREQQENFSRHLFRRAIEATENRARAREEALRREREERERLEKEREEEERSQIEYKKNSIRDAIAIFMFFFYLVVPVGSLIWTCAHVGLFPDVIDYENHYKAERVMSSGGIKNPDCVSVLYRLSDLPRGKCWVLKSRSYTHPDNPIGLIGKTIWASLFVSLGPALAFGAWLRFTERNTYHRSMEQLRDIAGESVKLLANKVWSVVKPYSVFLAVGGTALLGLYWWRVYEAYSGLPPIP